ncbi:hypothetical protein SADUNF_Sadunf01G0133100 [Salix dunnii]|uniref:CCAAT-binding factor domain-containing protein n=1 Tax=Salix dunnii TaxID=1413687 RepID=A0A835NBH3_9ROSI|nr:hypothetical protein SADUNF_Sadunf01G0133100 [Salix dunnii]
MVTEKSTKTSKDNIEALKSEVASFASSLGLASSASSYSGFNDTDFRKPKPKSKPKPKQKDHKPPPPPSQKTQLDKKTLSKPPTFRIKNDKSQKPISKPTPKPPVLSLDAGDDDQNSNSTRKFDKYKNLPKLPLVKAGAVGVWHVDLMELENKVLGEESKGKLEVKMGVGEWKSYVEKKRELGERLLWQYGKDYEQGRGQKGDIKMLVATQRSGTNADKVSAFSVLIGDNPVGNLRSLDALLGMVTSKVGKRHALTGFEALKELFISTLLPDRKLKTLLQRPLNKVPETKDGYSLLLFWYWEDCLKQRYERFVFALEEASRDMLPALKDKSLKIMYALLKSKSEQERRLLSALVNKLGDPQNKSASNADYHLSNLLSDHPNMKAVVIDEVDSFLFRPHLGLRSKYHAVNFLSQIRLSHRGDGPKVAKRMIDVYFALFKVLITEAGSSKKMDKNSKAEKNTCGSSKENEIKNSPESPIELDSRLLSALLTGVNRAFPYVSSVEADDIIEVQTPTLFQLVHSKNFNVGIQALMLLDKISSKNQIAEMFIGLLLRAMKSDVNLKRVAAFSKRLLQVALQQPPQYSCGCLFLLSEVLKARPPLWNMVLQSESVDEDLEHFEDIVEETDNELSTTPKKQEIGVDLVGNSGKIDSESDSAEDEDDSPASSSEDDVSDEDELLMKDSSKEPQESQPKSDHNGNQPQINSSGSSLPGGYDPRHREPSYCNADHASWWELMVLASHAHPSVATMAGTLLSGANIVYNGNPLNDLSLTAFLDKFMEKKPKQTAWHGGSQIEPAKKLDMNMHLIGPEILSLAEVDVPPEDLVFHKFYVNKMNTSKPKKKKKKKAAEEEAAEDLFDVGDGDGGDDDDVVGDDESDNEEIDDLLDSANLSHGAENEYDYDDLDQVVNEDDEDLVDDVEVDALSDTEGEDFNTIADSDNDTVDVGDADDGTDEDVLVQQKRKRKSRGKAGASPFASLEEYEHILNEDTATKKKSERKKKSKSLKKRKSSK